MARYLLLFNLRLRTRIGYYQASEKGAPVCKIGSLGLTLDIKAKIKTRSLAGGVFD